MSQTAWSGAAERPSVAPETTWPHQLSHAASLRVGDVLGALRHDFPSLTPSKLRFLDAQGLVSPSRTGAGYRLYSASDVERLRFVLRQQRDHYAPLHVIGARLADLDAGRSHEPVALSVAAGGAEEDVAIDAVAATAGVEPSLVLALVEAGLVVPAVPGRLPRAAVGLVVAAARYMVAGADVREVRALVRAAEREVEAATVAASPLRRRDDDSEATSSVVTRAEAAAVVFAEALRARAATPW